MDKQDQSFHYTYSAKQKEEIDGIRQKYLPRTEDKMEQLRRLDRSTETLGMAAALAAGVTGTLVFGLGMCCVTVWGNALFVLGILVGLIGIAGMAAAFPLYKRITRARRAKIAPEILKLADEVQKGI